MPFSVNQTVVSNTAVNLFTATDDTHIQMGMDGLQADVYIGPTSSVTYTSGFAINSAQVSPVGNTSGGGVLQFDIKAGDEVWAIVRNTASATTVYLLATY